MKRTFYLFNPGRMTRKDNTLCFVATDEKGRPDADGDVKEKKHPCSRVQGPGDRFAFGKARRAERDGKGNRTQDKRAEQAAVFEAEVGPDERTGTLDLDCVYEPALIDKKYYPVPRDDENPDKLAIDFAIESKDYRFLELLTEVVNSDPFQMRTFLPSAGANP